MPSLSKSLLIVAAFLALGLGCGDDVTAPPDPEDVPSAPDALFYEPVSFCLTGAQSADSLFIYNLSDSLLLWKPADIPDGATGLGEDLEIPPGTIWVLNWTWDPAGPYPVLDTLVAETNDPSRPRVVIPIRREDPATSPPTRVPDAPILALPLDGDTVVYPDTVVTLLWSRVQTCTGPATAYTVQISESPSFSGGSQSLRVNTPTAEVIFDGAGRDRGVTLYWRAAARVTSGGGTLTGPWSRVRSVSHQ